MKKLFCITYEIATPESAEWGEAEETGIHMDYLSYSEAMTYLMHMGAIGCHCEADSYPISTAFPPRWFTFDRVQENYATGEVINYALHVPDSVTPSSRMRIARALGCYGMEKR